MSNEIFQRGKVNFAKKCNGLDGWCCYCEGHPGQCKSETDAKAEQTTHTPGPWRVGDIRVMSDRTPNDQKDMHWPIFWPDCGCAAHVFKLEDAKLIAAAPELMSAMERLLRSISAHTKAKADFHRDIDTGRERKSEADLRRSERERLRAIEACREAIAKAKGGAK